MQRLSMLPVFSGHCEDVSCYTRYSQAQPEKISCVIFPGKAKTNLADGAKEINTQLSDTVESSENTLLMYRWKTAQTFNSTQMALIFLKSGLNPVCATSILAVAKNKMFRKWDNLQMHLNTEVNTVH